MSRRNLNDPANWAEIDDRARDGKTQLVAMGKYFAVVRWNGERFVFPGSNAPLEAEPDRYFVRENAPDA